MNDRIYSSCSVTKALEGPCCVSKDLKVRIFAACQAGESHCQTARRFSVSQGFVSKMMKRFRETGSLVVLEKEKQGPNFRFTRKQEEKLGKMGLISQQTLDRQVNCLATKMR